MFFLRAKQNKKDSRVGRKREVTETGHVGHRAYARETSGTKGIGNPANGPNISTGLYLRYRPTVDNEIASLVSKVSQSFFKR